MRNLSSRVARIRTCLLMAFAAFGPACSGTIGGERFPDGDDSNPSGPAPSNGNGEKPAVGGTGEPLSYAPARMHRLTADELGNILKDAFAGSPIQGAGLQAPTSRRDYDALTVSDIDDSLGDALQVNAERVSAALRPKLRTMAPCAGGTADEPACMKAFVQGLSPRLFRRPATAADQQVLASVFAEVRKIGTYEDGLAAVVETMLQSPDFLYVKEIGTVVSGRPDVLALDPLALASYMSLALWKAAPDDQLLTAATSGKLNSAPEIEMQAVRLLASPRAKEALVDFLMQWLELNPNVVKVDPAFTPELSAAIETEARRFFRLTLADPKAGLSKLLKSTRTEVNSDVATLYGLPSTPTRSKTEFVAAELNPNLRSGLLTLPSFIASHMPPGNSSPIFIGAFVQNKFFCSPLPPPPPGTTQPPTDPNLSTRERMAQHKSDKGCAGCHVRMDDIGFGFERYDQLGRYRETELAGTRTVPLSGQGKLVGTDVDGAFTGPVELAAKLSDSAMVRDCFTSQVVTSVLRRRVVGENVRTTADTAALVALAPMAAGNLNDLVTAVVSSDPFRFRSTK